MTKRAPLSLREQADFIEAIAGRCIMRDGSVAAETHITLTVKDVDDLKHLAFRLFLLAPHEAAIKKLVTGK